MRLRIRWVLFDLNGTLLDPSGVGAPLGLSPDHSLAALDDAILASMAETLSGSYRPLPELLRAALAGRAGLIGSGSGRRLDEAVERARAMPAFPDCAPAFDELARDGIEIGVLTNSPRAGAERALAAAGLSERTTLVAGSDEVEVFKPHPNVYRLGIERTGVAAGEICMIAAHWWDLMGASRAGMRTAYVCRYGRRPLPIGPAPDVVADTLTEVAERMRTI